MKTSAPRFELANQFVESARDMGDAMIIAAAVRVWYAINFPRTRPCSDADKALFIEWQNQ